MFDLEKCISDRRKQMIEAGIKTPVPLEELERHLREDIERQLESGMNRREAFDFAIQQIGQAGTLRKEFGKVGEVMPARQRKFNFAVCGVAAILSGLAGLVILFMPFGDSSRTALHERFLLSGGFFCAALNLWSWRFWRGFFPVLSNGMRMIVAILCSVWSGFCAVRVLHLVLSSVNSIDQLLAGAAGMTVPFALAASLIFALEEAAYRKTAMSDW